MPSYDELILVANPERMDRAVLRRFLDALEDGVRYLVNHPDERWALFLRGRSELNDELNRRAWRDTLTRFALRPAALDRARYARFAQFMYEQGLIPEALSVADYATILE